MGLEEILVGIWSFASLFGSEQPRFNQHDAEIGTSNIKNDEARFINASEIERDDQYENNEEPLISNKGMVALTINQLTIVGLVLFAKVCPPVSQ